MGRRPALQDLAPGAPKREPMLAAERDDCLRIGMSIDRATPHDIDHAARMTNQCRLACADGRPITFGVLDRPGGEHIGRLIDVAKLPERPAEIT